MWSTLYEEPYAQPRLVFRRAGATVNQRTKMRWENTPDNPDASAEMLMENKWVLQRLTRRQNAPSADGERANCTCGGRVVCVWGGAVGLTPPTTAESRWLLCWIAGCWLQSLKSSVLFNLSSLPYKAKDLFLGYYHYSCLKRRSAWRH